MRRRIAYVCFNRREGQIKVHGPAAIGGEFCKRVLMQAGGLDPLGTLSHRA